MNMSATRLAPQISNASHQATPKPAGAVPRKSAMAPTDNAYGSCVVTWSM